MSTEAPFDNIASTYDNEFSKTLIGQMQRSCIYSQIEPYLNKHKALKILELNCGTGIDARWMASLGHHVIATDASSGMIDFAKLQNENLDNPIFQKLSFNQIEASMFEGKFDMIFSNFAGLNCANKEELQQLNGRLKEMLNANGKLYFVLLGKYSWMEKLYFFIKGDKVRINRRLRMDKAQLGVDLYVNTWCYTSKEFSEIFADFIIVKERPIGLFIPPSYLEPLLHKNRLFIPIVKWLEKAFGSLSFFANYGDHIFLEFKLKA